MTASTDLIRLVIVEDNESLRKALITGLEQTGKVRIGFDFGAAEDVLADTDSFEAEIDAVLMDVHLAGHMNGIDPAVALWSHLPRLRVVFYSIQDEDSYFRDFCNSGILTHFAYVKKSNYLLPDMILPLLKDAIAGKGFIDPEIEARVQEVRRKDKRSPMDLLEPSERRVAHLLAVGLSNQQIAERLNIRDKRTVSRINGQIYATWGLNDTTADEKVARTRASIIVREARMIMWDDDGTAHVEDASGEWVEWNQA